MKKSLFRAKRAPTKARPKKPLAPIEPVNAPLYPSIEDMYPHLHVEELEEPLTEPMPRARPMPPVTKSGRDMFDHLSDDELLARIQDPRLYPSTFDPTFRTFEEIELERRYARRKAEAKRTLVRSAIPLPWMNHAKQ
jgi:hypothetical protein